MIPRIFVHSEDYSKYFERKFNPPEISSKEDGEKFDTEFDGCHTRLIDLLSPFGRFFNDTDIETADFDLNWGHNFSRWFNVRLFSTKLIETTDDLLALIASFSQPLNEDYAVWVDCDYSFDDAVEDEDDEEPLPLIEAIILRDRIITPATIPEFAEELIEDFGFSRESFENLQK